jgi:membrane fusion protein, copper/silver efflux system
MKRKKYINGLLVLMLVVGAFAAGYFYSRRGASDRSGPALSLTKPEPASMSSAPQSPSSANTPSSASPATVEISPEKQQVIGVRTGTVEKAAPASYTLRALGRVTADETRVYRVNLAVDGWISEVYDRATGSQVKKGETLASFYSPEFLSAEQAYIFALSSQDRYKTTAKEASGQANVIQTNIQQYVDTLKNLGMGDTQIQEIAKTRLYTENIRIAAPADGFILQRSLSPGQRFEKGTELYRIADLRKVWVLVDLYGNEPDYIRPGTTVSFSLPRQQRKFRATVSKILPQFDPNSRTLKVRLETDNDDYALRPDMFVDVECPITLPPAITVPIDALLDSGLRKTVFVDRGSGFFEPRQVETGWRFGNRVEIVKGLKPGERIVVSGNFLLDSESRMRTEVPKTAAAGRTTSPSPEPSGKGAMGQSND